MARILGFIGIQHAQADGFDYWLSFAAEAGFAFGVNEPGSRRGAEGQAAFVMTIGCAACLSAASSAHPTTIAMTSGAPHSIRPFGPDGGLGDSVFAYFFRPIVITSGKAHQLAQQAAKWF